MTDWKFIWNEFCDDVAKSVKKGDMERYFEKNIAKELLSACGWNKYSGLIEQYEIGVATTNIYADFALVPAKDSKPDVIIELKRPKNKKRDKYTKQLHDYMRQKECNYGILMLGTQMEVYHRVNSTYELVDAIKYEHNNEAAHYLIDLLTRDNFKVERIQEYCLDRTIVNKKLNYWSSEEGVNRMKEMIALAENDLSLKQREIFLSSIHLSITRQTEKIVEQTSSIEVSVHNAPNDDLSQTINVVPNIIPEPKSNDAPRLFSQTTLVSYLRNFNSEKTRTIVEAMGIKQPLAEITDANVLKKINEAIKVYEKQNGIHHTHSCAVSKYIEYINHGLTYEDFEHDAMLVKNGGKIVGKPAEQKTSAKKNTTKEKKSDKLPPFKFSMIGLKAGDKVIFDSRGIEVTVASDDKIEYQGRTYSLSGFCVAFLPPNLQNSSNAYQGPKYFSYQGKTLKKIRKEIETK